MSLDGDPEAEAASPAAKTGDVTVAAGSAHATASAFSPRVATHSHYPDGTEEIVIEGRGFAHPAVQQVRIGGSTSSYWAIGALPRRSRMYYRPAGRCAARFTARRGLGCILAIALSGRRR